MARQCVVRNVRSFRLGKFPSESHSVASVSNSLWDEEKVSLTSSLLVKRLNSTLFIHEASPVEFNFPIEPLSPIPGISVPCTRASCSLHALRNRSSSRFNIMTLYTWYYNHSTMPLRPYRTGSRTLADRDLVLHIPPISMILGLLYSIHATISKSLCRISYKWEHSRRLDTIDATKYE